MSLYNFYSNINVVMLSVAVNDAVTCKQKKTYRPVLHLLEFLLNIPLIAFKLLINKHLAS